MAENHPVGFQWVIEARERGAKIIHVDPRFTRTSAMADIWVPLRAGTDILFLGGLINYTLQRDKYFREYVVSYTNAPTLINENFKDTEDLGGVFSDAGREHECIHAAECGRQSANFFGDAVDEVIDGELCFRFFAPEHRDPDGLFATSRVYVSSLG